MPAVLVECVQSTRSDDGQRCGKCGHKFSWSLEKHYCSINGCLNVFCRFHGAATHKGKCRPEHMCVCFAHQKRVYEQRRSNMRNVT
jgi:hypothetical protein